MYSHGLVESCLYLCFAAKDLGETCDIDEQCAAGDGGASSVCDTSCKTGKMDELVTPFCFFILLTCLFNVHTIIPNFYIVKLWLTGVCIFFLSLL